MAGETFLKQWVGKDGAAAQGPAKQHEFSVYVPPLMALLDEVGAREIVDFQADEGVVSVAFCAGGADRHATFVAITGADDPEGYFKEMTDGITGEAQSRGQVTVTASAKDIAAASADAILFNNILGCQGCVGNVDAVLADTLPVVKADGYAVVTVPNPDGGKFSSYTCSNLPVDKAHGGEYDFQMAGETAVYKNLYLTEAGLKAAFARHGFGFVKASDVGDKPYQGFVSQDPAFRQYLFRRAP